MEKASLDQTTLLSSQPELRNTSYHHVRSITKRQLINLLAEARSAGFLSDDLVGGKQSAKLYI